MFATDTEGLSAAQRIAVGEPPLAQPPKIAFKPDGGIQSYRVYADGVLVGTVRYWERRYNLRRLYVSRGWRAWNAEGGAVGFHRDCATADTRRDAALALVEHAERQQA